MWARPLTHCILFSPGPLASLPMFSWTKQTSLSEQMSRRVRAIFGAMNFWAIIMYNLVSLNSPEFTDLVAQRLLLSGEGQWIQNVPCIHFENRDLLKCPHPTIIPQGPNREGTIKWGEKSHGGEGALLLGPMTCSPPRVPPDHAGHPVCHLLWCPTGEGARANPGSGGGTEAGQREAGVGAEGKRRGFCSALPGPWPRPGQMGPD